VFLIAENEYHLGGKMPRSSPEMEKWHKHSGKRLVFFGLLVFIVGLMNYLQFSWPMILMVAGILMTLFGLLKMMK
jgi:hypothetical protein